MNRSITTYLLLLIFAAVIYAPSVSSQPIQYENREVQVGGGCPPLDNGFDDTLRNMWAVIQTDKSAARIRASWNCSLGSSYDWGTVLYDRQKQTVTLYNRMGHGDANLHGREYYRVLKVTDKTWQIIGQRMEKVPRGEFIFSFQNLKKDGYKVEALG